MISILNSKTPVLAASGAVDATLIKAVGIP